MLCPCSGPHPNLHSLRVLLTALCSTTTACLCLCWFSPLEISRVCSPFSPPSPRGQFLMIQLKSCSHSSPWERNLQKGILHKSLLQSLAHQLPPPPDCFPHGREWALLPFVPQPIAQQPWSRKCCSLPVNSGCASSRCCCYNGKARGHFWAKEWNIKNGILGV